MQPLYLGTHSLLRVGDQVSLPEAVLSFSIP